MLEKNKGSICSMQRHCQPFKDQTSSTLYVHKDLQFIPHREYKNPFDRMNQGLTTCTEIITIYSERYMEHISTLCGRKPEFVLLWR
jgi:hypothetical protein